MTTGRRALVSALAVVALAACHLYHPAAVAGAPADAPDSVYPRALSPRDLTGSVTAWAEVFGADSIFQPRVTRLTANTIGVHLAHAAHVAVIVATSCGPWAAVPGRELTTRAPAGEQLYTLTPMRPAGCPPNFWRPVITVIAAELPMHGDVLTERARQAHTMDELMAPRQDRWAAYAVYSAR